MKNVLKTVLAIVGLAPLSTVRAQQNLIDEMKGRAHLAKAKRDEAVVRAKTLEAEVRRQGKTIETLRAGADRAQQQMASVDLLVKQLASAEHELAVARDHLMAVEVKLDILEGAANILDMRTRTAIAKRRSETGASV